MIIVECQLINLNSALWQREMTNENGTNSWINRWTKNHGPSGQHGDVGLKSRLPVSNPDLKVGAIERKRYFHKAMKISTNKEVVIGNIVRNLCH